MVLLVYCLMGMLVSTSLATTDNQCDLPGLCDGTFLGANIAQSKAECVLFCRETPGCFWYSWDMNTKICGAMADCPSLDESMTNTTSGNKECSEFTCNKTEKCEGVVVDFDLSPNVDSCLRLCQLNPLCRWFTYLDVDKVCVQLADCPKFSPCEDCLSGQEECRGEGAGQMNKVLVVYNSDLTLVDLNNVSSSCTVPSYPVPTSGPAAMLYDEMEGVVRSCGGYIPTKAATNRCFKFDGLQWTEIQSTNGSYEASYLVTLSSYVPDHGWWIFSCDSWHGAGCSVNKTHSEIFLDSTHAWVEGPRLPSYQSEFRDDFPGSYCTVQLNSTHTMITGGILDSDGGSIADVWLYNWSEERWVQGPSMASRRREHMCVSLGDGRVIVAGGRGEFGEQVLSTEVFDQTVGGWYQSQDLPEEPDFCNYGCSKLISWNGVPVWIDGAHPSKFWKFEDGSWVKLGNWGFHGFHLALTVPDDFIPNC